jgi:hypothetical protein
MNVVRTLVDLAIIGVMVVGAIYLIGGVVIGCVAG